VNLANTDDWISFLFKIGRKSKILLRPLHKNEMQAWSNVCVLVRRMTEVVCDSAKCISLLYAVVTPVMVLFFYTVEPVTVLVIAVSNATANSPRVAKTAGMSADGSSPR
jgi:hypothetical protein